MAYPRVEKLCSFLMKASFELLGSFSSVYCRRRTSLGHPGCWHPRLYPEIFSFSSL